MTTVENTKVGSLTHANSINREDGFLNRKNLQRYRKQASVVRTGDGEEPKDQSGLYSVDHNSCPPPAPADNSYPSDAANSSNSLHNSNNNNCHQPEQLLGKMNRAEEIERLIEDPEDKPEGATQASEKIPGGSYNKGSSGLFLNAASIITGTSKQESEEVYNEKFNTRSLRKDNSCRKVNKEKEGKPGQSDFCPDFWFHCPRERRCESLSWKMCFFCFCLPVCYPCYLSRMIRRRNRRRQELEKRDFQPGNLISRAQETLSSQGSRMSSPRKRRLEEDWIDVDIIFTKSPLSEKIISEIKKHSEFKQCRSSEHKSPEQRGSTVPEGINIPADSLSAITEMSGQDHESSPIILRRSGQPIKIPTSPRTLDLPSPPTSNMSPSSPSLPGESEKFFSLESVIESSPSNPTSPVNSPSDDPRFFSLPPSNASERIKNGLGSLSSGSVRFASAAESLTSGSGRYYTPQESLTSGSARYLSAAGSLLSGQSGRYFSAAESLSSGYGRQLNHAGSLVSTAPSEYITPAASLVSCDLLACPPPVISADQDGQSHDNPDADPLLPEPGLSDREEHLETNEPVIYNGFNHHSDDNPEEMHINSINHVTESRCTDGVQERGDNPMDSREALTKVTTSDITICDNQSRQEPQIQTRPKTRGEQSQTVSRIPRCTLNSISTIEEDDDPTSLDATDGHGSPSNQENLPTFRKSRSIGRSPWSPIKLGSVERTIEKQAIRLNFYQDRDSETEQGSSDDSGEIPSVHLVVVAYRDAGQLDERLAEGGGVLSYLREYWSGYYPLLLVRMNGKETGILDPAPSGDTTNRNQGEDTVDSQNEPKRLDPSGVEERTSRIPANFRRKAKQPQRNGSRRGWEQDRVNDFGLFSDHHRLFMREDLDVDFLLDSLARYYLHCTLFQCEDRMDTEPNLPLNPPTWRCNGLCKLASKPAKKANKKSSKNGFLKSVRKTMYIRRLTSQVSQE